ACGGRQRAEARAGACAGGGGRTEVGGFRAAANVLCLFVGPKGETRGGPRRSRRAGCPWCGCTRRRGTDRGWRRLARLRVDMGKKTRERALAENEAEAIARMLRGSPPKLNLVAQLLPRKKVATR